MSIILIAKYYCTIAGEMTDSLDYQVRYFDSSLPDEVVTRLATEPPHEYKNSNNETVRWIFDGVVSLELNSSFEDGKEIVGFITEEQKV